ncbi:MAG: glycosyl hydrolase, partial [Bacteroidales bacterium]
MLSVLGLTQPLNSQSLVNPNADSNAIRLKTFLDSIYGKKIISGQAYEAVNEKWNEYIFEQTGKLPAILSLDFMNSMPWRVSQGTDPDTAANLAIFWHKQMGGIVEMHWHWDAPKNANYSTWQAFYTKNTTFDLAYALSDTSSEDYKLLIRDMDIVANLLKRMRDSGVPVLWRPLHEAEGGWFWWGAKGGDACKKLWWTMYNRFTRFHNLTNLIWVWNSYVDEKGVNWYP